LNVQKSTGSGIMPSESSSVKFKPIDIKEVFWEKDPALARYFPDFVFKLIHRVMRLDFINSFIIKYGHLTGMDFINASIKDFEIVEEVLGGENIPESGSFIFAGNHPLGGFDSMLLMENVYKRLGDFKFLANDVMMNVPPLHSLVVPVNHHGSNSRETALLLQKTYRSGQQILIFPSGLASRRIRGKVVDLDWHKHFISKSIEYKRDVIPVFISGRNSHRFYNVARWRTFLGITWNLEMFLLPDETYRHRKKKIQLYFGKPIPYTTFDRSHSHQEWADWVKARVYELPGLLQPKI
jgi:1-acyl-sn-glycerol-3-phosphate acyltransferase